MLKQSNLVDGEEDLDAPPDVLAALHSKITLKDALQGYKRIFCVGLALDYCVLDTALNAKIGGFEEVVMVFDACRAAYVPNVGKHGTGFLQDPAWVTKQLKKANVQVCMTANLFHSLERRTSTMPMPIALLRDQPSATFPECLEKMGLVAIGEFGGDKPDEGAASASASASKSPAQYFKFEREKADDHSGAHVNTCTVSFEALGLKFLAGIGVQNTANASPRTPVTLSPEVKREAGINISATAFQWVYPMKGVENLPEVTLGYFAQTHPLLSFLLLGGFVYFDSDDNLIDACAIKKDTDSGGISFSPPSAIADPIINYLAREQRWHPVTSGRMKKAHATHFAWLNPGEEVGTTDPFKAPEDGAFLFLFSSEGNKALISAGTVDDKATARSYPVEDCSLPQQNVVYAAVRFKQSVIDKSEDTTATAAPAASAAAGAGPKSKVSSGEKSRACTVM